MCNSRIWISSQTEKCPYVSVLVSGDGDELRLREGESLDSSRLAGVLCPIFVHFHHMEPGLVLVERLEDHHLEVSMEEIHFQSLGRWFKHHAAVFKFVIINWAKALLRIMTQAYRKGGLKIKWTAGVTWPVLLEAPLLLVSFSFPNEISWRIQCAPVFGESGCM